MVHKTSHGLAHQSMARPNTVWKGTALAVGALPPFPAGWGGTCPRCPPPGPVPTPMRMVTNPAYEEQCSDLDTAMECTKSRDQPAELSAQDSNLQNYKLSF